MKDQDSHQWYNGTEHFLIGLSPQYWSYTPMLICDVNRLALINGIDCILCHVSCKEGLKTKATVSFDELKNEENQRSQLYRVLPVSRCELCGVIVNLEYRANKVFHFLLDDGTGIVDCISWNNNVHQLPPINESNFTHQRDGYEVGDMVRVLGKIKCVDLTSSTNDVQIVSRTVCGKERYENIKYRKCVREIHVVQMENVDCEDNHRMAKQNSPTPTNYETLHWLKSLHFMERLNSVSENDKMHSEKGNDFSPRNSITGIGNHNNTQREVHLRGDSLEMDSQYESEDDDYEYLVLSKRKFVPNGADILLNQLKMGKYLKNGALEFSRMISDPKGQAFGENCKCEQSYKRNLLYCQCNATKEQLDPQFRFRDALLNKLLDMEDQSVSMPDFQTRKKHITTKSLHLLTSQNDKIDWILGSPSLKFNYADLLGDEKLTLISKDIVKSTSNPIINQKRLFTRTLLALRKDGIIFLIDENLDEYLLISFQRVLEPIMTQLLWSSSSKGNYTRKDLPFFLKNVPQSRFEATEDIIRRNKNQS